MGLQPPAVPVFLAGVEVGTVPAVFNANIRDPFTFLLDRPRARLRRGSALNLTEGVHQYVPWSVADEDSQPGGGSGWSAGNTVGGGGSSTLNGATSAGATSVTLVSATGFAIGDFVRIDTGANQETRLISNVAGNVLTVPALTLAHSSGVAAVEVDADPSRYVCQAPGWYLVTGKVSLSGTGATSLVLLPALAVNGASHTGIGSAGWEGDELYVPTGASSQPKVANGTWRVYMNVGDYLQLDLFFTSESAITAVDTTAGIECSLELVWDGV